MEKSAEERWYAMKVYYNRTALLREQLVADGVNYFIPEMIASLLFVKASGSYLTQFEKNYHERLWVYRDPLSHRPSAIPDREMEVFIFVCTAGKQGLTYLGEDRPEYHEGDRVRVTEGLLKGAEGYIKRIKKDRRLVVSVRGVAAVATTYVPPQFLEAISE
ncbi:MAG: transcriptional regulator [Bacteroidales bacterium]|nr:transcriptional regulator [Bacteroidales bacterium]